MARPGVTYQDIAKAATKLMEQNTRPSIEAVRRELGTGSNSTINRHLREWQAKQGNQIELEQGLPETLLIAVRGLYEAMGDDAKRKYAQVEAENNQLVANFKIKIEALESSHGALNQEKIALENKLAQTHEESSALQRQLDNLKKERDIQTADNHLLTERLSDKQSEIERLTQLLKHTQSNLDHYRETMRQERLSDRQAFEEKIAALENQRHLQQGQASQAREEIARLKQHIETLENAKKVVAKVETDALEKIQRYESDLQTSQHKLAQLHQSHEQLLSAHHALTKEIDLDRTKISELTIKTEKQSERIELQEIALKKAEDSLKSLADKHLFLTQEKTELAFQLKQMLEAS